MSFMKFDYALMFIVVWLAASIFLSFYHLRHLQLNLNSRLNYLYNKKSFNSNIKMFNICIVNQ